MDDNIVRNENQQSLDHDDDYPHDIHPDDQHEHMDLDHAFSINDSEEAQNGRGTSVNSLDFALQIENPFSR